MIQMLSGDEASFTERRACLLQTSPYGEITPLYESTKVTKQDVTQLQDVWIGNTESPLLICILRLLYY